jgi:hypothetical protein
MRHRSAELWEEPLRFNPDREWQDEEVWHHQRWAAYNPSTPRFSPFTYDEHHI